MVKAITFDLDGVYFPNGKANFISALRELGVSEDEAKRVFLKSEEMNQMYKNGKMTDEQFWTWAANEWKVDKTPSELINLLISGYDVDSKVVETVRQVRKNGYKTLICTNNFPARMEGLQKKFKFIDDFDIVVVSYEIGVSKPSEMIFQALVDKSGCVAGEIAFADDHEENVVSARNVGITAFLYEGFDGFIEQLRELGVRI